MLACAVRLLDLGFFRIGSEDYAERNESYGLTTMLREHVTFDDGEIVFDFPAKSGQRRIQAIADPEALAVIAALKRRRSGDPAARLSRRRRHWMEVARRGGQRIHQAATRGGAFSAKDFRTWNATVLAAVALAASDARRRAARSVSGRSVSAIKTVAAYLGNTPAVCRASYVDPRVIDRYRAGATIADGARGPPRGRARPVERHRPQARRGRRPGPARRTRPCGLGPAGVGVGGGGRAAARAGGPRRMGRSLFKVPRLG